MKILCVCSGNICRSPIAEGYLRSKYNVDASSAGVYTINGSAASQNSITVMDEIDINISGHLSRVITADMLIENDYILTMTREHSLFILSAFSHMKDELEKKLLILDINDPFSGTEAQYRHCRDSIIKAIDEIMIKISHPK